MQKRLVLAKVSRTDNGMSIPQGLILGDKAQSASVIAHHFGVRVVVSRCDDDGDLVHAGAQGFFDNDAQHGLFCAIAVDERL